MDYNAVYLSHGNGKGQQEAIRHQNISRKGLGYLEEDGCWHEEKKAQIKFNYRAKVLIRKLPRSLISPFHTLQIILSLNYFQNNLYMTIPFTLTFKGARNIIFLPLNKSF